MGVMGSGKDYQAQLLLKQGATSVAFADGVRNDIWRLIGWAPTTEAEYEAFKSTVFTTVGPKAKQLGIPEFTGRDLMQIYGTEIRRSEDPNIWAKRGVIEVQRALNMYDTVAVTDCRFYNEMQHLIELQDQNLAKVDFVFCDYKSDRYKADFDHPSEHLAQHILRNYDFEHLDLNFNDWAHRVDMCDMPITVL